MISGALPFMSKLSRDPLIHFLALGALLFVGHALWSTLVTRADRQLIVETREIARQSDLFTIENGRAPTEAELQGIIVAFVEEEVLTREGERLGLDQDDTVIRRRIAQKMRLLTDTGPVTEPSEAELKTWFNTRREDYAVAERRSLQHVFFSDDRRADAKADAGVADLTDWTQVGDPFIIARELGPLSRNKVQQDYGGPFASTVFDAEIGVWSDPVRSPFGIHRIRVTEVIPRIEPDFTRAREEVLADWMDEANTARVDQAMRDLVAKYDVIVEE